MFGLTKGSSLFLKNGFPEKQIVFDRLFQNLKDPTNVWQRLSDTYASLGTRGDTFPEKVSKSERGEDESKELKKEKER